MVENDNLCENHSLKKNLKYFCIFFLLFKKDFFLFFLLQKLDPCSLTGPPRLPYGISRATRTGPPRLQGSNFFRRKMRKKSNFLSKKTCQNTSSGLSRSQTVKLHSGFCLIVFGDQRTLTCLPFV